VLIIRRSKLYYTASGIVTLKQVSGLKLLKYSKILKKGGGGMSRSRLQRVSFLYIANHHRKSDRVLKLNFMERMV